MAQVRLSQAFVDGEAAAPAERIIWDDALRGFGVKITPAGAKVYLIQYRAKGSRATRRYTIGRHGDPWRTEKARGKAADLLARVRLGEDPFLTDRRVREAEQAEAASADHAKALAEVAKAEAKAVETKAEREAFQRIVKKFIKKYAKPRNRSWEQAQRVLQSSDLDAWHDRPIASIKRADVIRLMDRVEKRSPPVARLLFAHLRKLFGWCVERLYIEVSPCTGLKAPTVSRARDRWLSDKELRLVWEACGQVGRPFGPLFRLLILTGQRREEVAAMRWSEIDLKAAEWTIPASRAKNAKAHIVDLVPQAVEILAQFKNREGLVFTTTGDTPVSGHSRGKARLDDAIENLRERKAKGEGLPAPLDDLPAWRVHDLRRTAATGMARLGHPPHVIEAVLNHSSGSRGGLVAVYQHYDHRSERQAALLDWGAHVQSLVGPKVDHPKALALDRTSLHKISMKSAS